MTSVNLEKARALETRHAATVAAQEKVERDGPPPPFLTGTFNMFKMPDGGFLVAWKRKGDSQARHLPIPAALLSMASAQTGRSVDELLAELIGATP